VYLSVALASMGLDAQPARGEQVAPPRSDKIGPFVVSYGLNRAEKDKILSQARGFLWDHLHNHMTGQLRITFGNLEGDPTEHTLVVRLDKKGSSVVRDQITTTQAALLRPGEKPRRRTFLDKFCAFERIDENTEESIPDGETRPAESFKLRLTAC
jgi:hypothetical protein